MLPCPSYLYLPVVNITQFSLTKPPQFSIIFVQGDSGGPLMVERQDGHWVLIGTVSHGIKCAAPYLPGVYMRTNYYKPWLQTITGVRTT